MMLRTLFMGSVLLVTACGGDNVSGSTAGNSTDRGRLLNFGSNTSTPNTSPATSNGAGDIECVPAPDVKVPAQAFDVGIVAENPAVSPCEPGKVPLHKGFVDLKGNPRHAKASAGIGEKNLEYVTNAWGNYSYVYAYQRPTDSPAGLLDWMTVERPYIWGTDPHSLAEITAESSDGQQIVEVGWIVNNGDPVPRLFVYHWVSGGTSCYNGCGWQPYDTTYYPGMSLDDVAGDNSAHLFAILHTDWGYAPYSGWWINYDNHWLGYFPDSIWTDHGITFNRVGLAQWFAEVAALPGNEPCSAMGDGAWGSDVNNSAWMTALSFTNGPPDYYAANASEQKTDPDWYDFGNAGPSSFNYGGPECAH